MGPKKIYLGYIRQLGSSTIDIVLEIMKMTWLIQNNLEFFLLINILLVSVLYWEPLLHGDDHADWSKWPIFSSFQGKIRRLEMGIKCNWGWGQFWNTNVLAGCNVGPSSIHVCDRTVERGPGLVRQGPSKDINACQRLRFPGYVFLFIWALECVCDCGLLCLYLVPFWFVCFSSWAILKTGTLH